MSFIKKITKEEINALEQMQFNGQVTIVNKTSELPEVIEKLSSAKILGFDTETKPNFTKGGANKVALLQFSTDEEAFLIRLDKVGLPQEICDILASKDILKVGVAIHDDIKTLKKLTPYKEAGFVELQDMAKDLGIKQLGLRSLAAMLLNSRVSKGAKLSNWENKNYTQAQIDYAATDAYVGLILYKKLFELSQS